MKKMAFLVVVALIAVMGAFHSTASAADMSMTVKLMAENGSGEDGTATITAVGANDIKVVVNLSNGTSTPQPAHIHNGNCGPTLNPKPLYPLTNVVNGQSDTTVMVGMAELAKGGYAINIHKSGTEVSTYVSCGNIQAMSMTGGNMTGGTTGGNMTGGNMTGGTTGGSTMPATGNSDELLYLVGLGLLALVLTSAGMRLARNRA